MMKPGFSLLEIVTKSRIQEEKTLRVNLRLRDCKENSIENYLVEAAEKSYPRKTLTDTQARPKKKRP